MLRELACALAPSSNDGWLPDPLLNRALFAKAVYNRLPKDLTGSTEQALGKALLDEAEKERRRKEKEGPGEGEKGVEGEAEAMMQD